MPRPPSRQIKLGRLQRGLVALCIDRGGSMLVRDGAILGTGWSSTADYVQSIDGLVSRGYLECNTEETHYDSRLYITPEGRKLIRHPLKVIAECIENHWGLFDARSLVMIDQALAILNAGGKVGIIVEDRKRRTDVLRAIRYATLGKAAYVATPLDARLDWSTMSIEGAAETGYTIFVEPYLVDKYLSAMQAYLQRYEKE